MAIKPTSPAPRRTRSGYRLFRTLGIDIVADWSLLIIFALVVLGLGGSVLPSWHPQWSMLLVWSLAALAGVCLIASVALHELAHAWVANRRGMRVRQITLFVFGGVTQLEGRPRSPKDELRIAIAGPLMSFALGAVAIVAGSLLAGTGLRGDGSVAQAVNDLGPVATLLLWLGPINVLLGVFNLLPGFPLDGGRVLRALLWRFFGDLHRATRWAARGGQALAWALMALGAMMALGLYLPILGGGAINGLWMLLIGWFLYSAARVTYQQTLITDALQEVEVGDIVHARPDQRVAADTMVATFVEDVAMTADTALLPVVNDRELVGVIDLERLERVPRAQWQSLTATDVMTPIAHIKTLRPRDAAVDALTVLASQNPVPVVDADHELVGMLRARDVGRWLAFHSNAEVQRPTDRRL